MTLNFLLYSFKLKYKLLCLDAYNFETEYITFRNV